MESDADTDPDVDLESIPGVGAKTADALRELEDPERALRDGDVATLARAPGVSGGRAARIARAAVRRRHDDPGGFLATDRARELYRDALSLLQERAVTDYGAKRLETLYPSGSDSRLAEAREFATRALARDPDPSVREALAGVSPLEAPGDVRVRDRCLATSDAETYARAREAVPELSVELVDDARQLAELARGYATVVALDAAFAGIDVEGDVRVQSDALDSPTEVVPERTLQFFATNRETLRAAVTVARRADLDVTCDLDTLADALERLDAEGEVTGDEELDRLTAAVEGLDTAVAEAERVANDGLREAIEQRDVTIEGTDLLSLVEQGAGVDSLLSQELSTEYETAVERAREHLVDALDLAGAADLARRAFGDRPTYPVEHDQEVVSRLREELRAARDRRRTRRKRELARDLAGLRADAETLVSTALELDVELAVARFAADFQCTMPTIGGDGFEIEAGRSPLLNVPFEAVETSTLDLVGLVVTLAHMGLPVPAEHARVERVAELHYYAKSQGTLDAGAFESTLREFGELVTEVSADRPVLVLVDELESITEPGASANIMAGILESLADRDATAVFVSHLAREIRAATDTDLAVDGIQAAGLVDGELRVDRSPVKGTLARSTPELIVEKLAGEDGTGFYEGLLEKF